MISYVSYIFEILATVIDILFLLWFVPSFNRSVFYKRKWTISLAAAALLFQLIIDHMQLNFDTVFVVVFFIICLAYSLAFSNGKYAQAMLATCLYLVVPMLLGSLLTPLFSLMVPNFDFVMTHSGKPIRIIFVVICKLMQFLFYKIILYIFRPEVRPDVKSGISSVIFTAVSSIVLSLLMVLYADYSNDGTDERTVIFVFLMFIGVSMLNVIFYFMIYHIQKLLKLKYELKLAEERLRFETERIEEANEVWENIRKVRHDIKNHLTVISGELKLGRVEKCLDYIKSIEPTIETVGNLIRSGNPIINYIVNSKLSGLDGIEVVISGNIDSFSDVEDIDIACILGNIIDNAVEAQEYVTGDKKIVLSFGQKGENRIIVCENTASPEVFDKNKEFFTSKAASNGEKTLKIKKNAPRLKSTKPQPEGHGLGQIIVENAVSKYNGIIDYYRKDRFFGVLIMLPTKEGKS